MPRSKYGNVKVTIDGHTFDSKAEGYRYIFLKQAEKKGEIYDLQLQPKFDLFGRGGAKICTYRADFGYKTKVGSARVSMVEDVKGFKTPVYRLKAKLFKDNYGFPITEIPVK